MCGGSLYEEELLYHGFLFTSLRKFAPKPCPPHWQYMAAWDGACTALVSTSRKAVISLVNQSPLLEVTSGIFNKDVTRNLSLVPSQLVPQFFESGPSLAAWQGPCQDLQLDGVHASYQTLHAKMKCWDLWEQFSLFCWLQDRSEQYQQSEAHSDKAFVKDSLTCLQRERNSQQSFVLTQTIETWRTPSVGKP